VIGTSRSYWLARAVEPDQPSMITPCRKKETHPIGPIPKTHSRQPPFMRVFIQPLRWTTTCATAPRKRKGTVWSLHTRPDCRSVPPACPPVSPGPTRGRPPPPARRRGAVAPNPPVHRARGHDGASAASPMGSRGSPAAPWSCAVRVAAAARRPPPAPQSPPPPPWRAARRPRAARPRVAAAAVTTAKKRGRREETGAAGTPHPGAAGRPASGGGGRAPSRRRGHAGGARLQAPPPAASRRRRAGGSPAPTGRRAVTAGPGGGTRVQEAARSRAFGGRPSPHAATRADTPAHQIAPALPVPGCSAA